MNAITRHVNQQAAKGFSIFFENLTKVSPHLKRKFLMSQKDEEHIDFSLDGYAFTLTWDEGKRQSIGREYIVPEYQLCIWHTTFGGRWNPPESIDTTLITTQSIHECITCALETVAKDEIRQCLEGVGYEIMEEVHEEIS